MIPRYRRYRVVVLRTYTSPVTPSEQIYFKAHQPWLAIFCQDQKKKRRQFMFSSQNPSGPVACNFWATQIYLWQILRKRTRNHSLWGCTSLPLRLVGFANRRCRTKCLSVLQYPDSVDQSLCFLVAAISLSLSLSHTHLVWLFF